MNSADLPQTDDALSMLLDSADDFLARAHSTRRVHALRDSDGHLEPEVWAQMASMGWLGLTLPEALGGSQLDVRHAAELAARLGAALLPEPFAACAVAPAALLRHAPATATVQRLAAALVEGRETLALAWQAAPGEIDASWSNMQCRAQGEHWQLVGDAIFVEAAATVWLVAASLAGEAVLVAVPASAPNAVRHSQRLADGSATQAVRLEGVVVGDDAVLLRGTEARTALSRALADWRVVSAAQLAGIGTGALDRTVAHLKQRVQFDQPIADFQAVRHRLVDLDLSKRLAFASWRHAAQLAATEASSRTLGLAVAAAKARCSDTALVIARAAVQLHGAFGYTQEADVGLYLNAAMRHACVLGNAAAHRRTVLSDWLSRDARAGTSAPYDRTSAASLAPSSSAILGEPERLDQLPDEEFAERLHRWLQVHCPPAMRVPVLLRLRGSEERRWLRLLHAHGLRGPGIAREHGGMGLSLRKQLLYKKVFDGNGVARVLDIGATLLAPVLIRYGTPQQKALWLPRILRCDDMWCQGYSEPGAGSDLASLRTSAQRHGDVFVVNGQKIWTSHAATASHIFALVRTRKEGRKQAGISFLLIDLASPGITVRPIVNLAGDDEFCEVFFDNVEVPVDQLVGGLDAGWTVAKSLLGVERLVTGSPTLALQAFDYLRGLLDAPDVRQAALQDDRLARALCDLHDTGQLYDEVCAAAVEGQALDAEYSVIKILSTELFQRVADLATDLANERGALRGGGETGMLAFDLHRLSMIARPGTIYGGTSEVQRDILARLLVGTPAPRV